MTQGHGRVATIDNDPGVHAQTRKDHTNFLYDGPDAAFSKCSPSVLMLLRKLHVELQNECRGTQTMRWPRRRLMILRDESTSRKKD